MMVLSGKVHLPHALLEQIDKEQIKAGHQANNKEEAEEGASGQFEHLMIQTFDKEIREGDVNLKCGMKIFKK
jgi:hypothetical protein